MNVGHRTQDSGASKRSSGRLIGSLNFAYSRLIRLFSLGGGRVRREKDDMSVLRTLGFLVLGSTEMSRLRRWGRAELCRVQLTRQERVMMDIFNSCRDEVLRLDRKTL
jgi:hypothetical protein